MNADDVLKSDREHFGTFLIGNLNPVRKSKVTFADLATCKIANSLLGALLSLTDADQLGAFGVQEHLVAVNMKEEAGHRNRNARGAAAFGDLLLFVQLQPPFIAVRARGLNLG